MWRLFALLALSYGTTVAVATLFQRRLQYFPMGAIRNPAECGVPEMDIVSLRTGDGVVLRAWWSPPRAGKATVLYLPGNAGNLGFRAPLVRPYLDAGFGVLLVAWRGFEGNPGHPNEGGLYQDARAAMAFLAAHQVRGARTIVYGELLGTAPAVLMACENAVAGLVLDSPFTSVVDVAAHHYWFLPVRRLTRDRYESVTRIRRLQAPLLVLHGSADAIVPIRFGRALFDAAPEPKELVVVEGAGHTGHARTAAAQVVAFIERHTERHLAAPRRAAG